MAWTLEIFKSAPSGSPSSTMPHSKPSQTSSTNWTQSIPMYQPMKTILIQATIFVYIFYGNIHWMFIWHMKIKLQKWFQVMLTASWRICNYNLLFSFLNTNNITYAIQDIAKQPLLDLKIRKTCLKSLSTCYYLQDGSGSFSWFSSSQSPMTEKLVSYLQWIPYWGRTTCYR